MFLLDSLSLLSFLADFTAPVVCCLNISKLWKEGLQMSGPGSPLHYCTFVARSMIITCPICLQLLCKDLIAGIRNGEVHDSLRSHMRF